ncbi:MAG: hypothetical protein KDM81_04075 [Verrucomicrobiae bacterium]|nr:hypothetical protein [Verrucomicrobiae bacterium]
MTVAATMAQTWVCFAVKEELRPFARRVAGRGGLRLLLTGMGAPNARCALEQALDSAPVLPDLVISSGFAGGLNPTLQRGQVIFEMPEVGVLPEGIQREPRGPGPGQETHGILAAGLVQSGAVAGRFVQSHRVAVTVEEKQSLHRSSGADAVEMESGALREICTARGIPCVVVRVISDAADEPLPLDFNALMTPDGRMDFRRLAGRLLRRPGLVPELLGFQRRVATAAERLAVVLEAVTAAPPAANPRSKR